MKKNQMKDGVIAENSAGLGTVTRKMLHDRAVELAVINGRSATEITKSDWEQSRQDLSGTLDADAEDFFESLPESKRWDPVPGTQGTKARVAPSEDEDEEGRSDNQKLVEGGVADAEFDQLRQAAKHR